MRKYIPLSVPNLKGNELKYVTKAIEEEWVSTGGAFIDEFETATADYVKAKGAVACQSGTAGLHLALLLHGIQHGDGVLVPALSFVAAVNPVKYVQAVPFFMDCDDSLCMDMDKVEAFCDRECFFEDNRLIHKRTKTHIKAMIIVHVFGNMADMEKALALKEKYNLVLIEDATEALGSYVNEGALKGRFAGTIGDIGVYSYNGNKIMTTGGGGMIVSNRESLLKEAKYLSTQAKDDTLYYVHNRVGYNYRMTNLQAALGLAQLEQLEDFIQIKTENYRRYQMLGIGLIPFRADIRANYWFYSYISRDRDYLIQKLEEQRIQTRPIWNLICGLKPYQNDCQYEIKTCKTYWERVVNLPCSTNLSLEDVEVVAENIRSIEGI